MGGGAVGRRGFIVTHKKRERSRKKRSQSKVSITGRGKIPPALGNMS